MQFPSSVSVIRRRRNVVEQKGLAAGLLATKNGRGRYTIKSVCRSCLIVLVGVKGTHSPHVIDLI